MVERLSLAEAPGWVAQRLVGLTGTRWVGIDGFGAAGKTTLAAAVAAALPRAVLVPIDDFARPGVLRWEQDRFLAQVVEPLLGGRAARYQRWDWGLDAGVGWHDVRAGSVVICEGVSSTDEALGVPWDLTLWLDVPEDLRRRRARTRDGEQLWSTWVEDWIPAEEAYALEQRPWERVDAIVVA